MRFVRISRYFFLVYFAGLGFFTFFRLLLLLLNTDKITGIPLHILLASFGMGLRFDNVILCYLLLLPYLIGNLPRIGMEKKVTRNIISSFFMAGFTLCFLICAGDIPYYHFSNERLTPVVMQWKDTPGFMIRLVLQDWAF